MDRYWPHQVILPASSCTGPSEKIIHDFCRDLSVCSRTHSLVKNEWALVWCFAEPEHAERFRERFGGEVFDPTPSHRLEEPIALMPAFSNEAARRGRWA
jgi:hypothetical protein